jgi:hypothetical protein
LTHWNSPARWMACFRAFLVNTLARWR